MIEVASTNGFIDQLKRQVSMKAQEFRVCKTRTFDPFNQLLSATAAQPDVSIVASPSFDNFFCKKSSIQSRILDRRANSKSLIYRKIDYRNPSVPEVVIPGHKNFIKNLDNPYDDHPQYMQTKQPQGGFQKQKVLMSHMRGISQRFDRKSIVQARKMIQSRSIQRAIDPFQPMKTR